MDNIPWHRIHIVLGWIMAICLWMSIFNTEKLKKEQVNLQSLVAKQALQIVDLRIELAGCKGGKQ